MRRAIIAAAALCLAAPSHAEGLFAFFAAHAGSAPIEQPIAARAQAYSGLVTRAAEAAGVPVRLALALVWVESGFNPHLRGRAGEWGLGQIKCATARAVGFTGACRRLAEPAVNLKFSMAYLRRALDAAGAGCAGVSLYNRGLGSRPRCTAYGRRVLALARR